MIRSLRRGAILPTAVLPAASLDRIPEGRDTPSAVHHKEIVIPNDVVDHSRREVAARLESPF
jgi:hypothetical protein